MDSPLGGAELSCPVSQQLPWVFDGKLPRFPLLRNLKYNFRFLNTSLRGLIFPPQEFAAFAGFRGALRLNRARQLDGIKSELLPDFVRRLQHLIKLLVLRRIDQAALKHGAPQIRRSHSHQPNLLFAIPGVGMANRRFGWW